MTPTDGMSDRPSEPRTECDCHRYGNASTCPIHTQADYDAAERNRRAEAALPSVEALARALQVVDHDMPAGLYDSNERAARLAALGQPVPDEQEGKA